MFCKVKSAVQALDPMSGIWLPGTVVAISGTSLTIKWKGYSETSVVTGDNVRKPIIKRCFRLNPNDWRDTDPRTYQKGDQILHKKPDGSTDLLLVEENDPWNCTIRAAGRCITYEFLQEVVPETGSLNIMPIVAEKNKPKESSTELAEKRKGPLSVSTKDNVKGNTKPKGATAGAAVVPLSVSQKTYAQRKPQNQQKRKMNKENTAPSATKKGKTAPKTKTVVKEKATILFLQPAAQGEDTENSEARPDTLSSSEREKLLTFGRQALQELQTEGTTVLTPSITEDIPSLPEAVPLLPLAPQLPPPTTNEEPTSLDTASSLLSGPPSPDKESPPYEVPVSPPHEVQLSLDIAPTLTPIPQLEQTLQQPENVPPLPKAVALPPSIFQEPTPMHPPEVPDPQPMPHCLPPQPMPHCLPPLPGPQQCQTATVPDPQPMPHCQLSPQPMPHCLPPLPGPQQCQPPLPLPYPSVSLEDRVTLLEVDLEVQREKYATLERQVGYLTALLSEKTQAISSSTPSAPDTVKAVPTLGLMEMTEENHFSPLRAIFANVCISSDCGGVVEGNISRSLVTSLAHLRGNPSSLGRALMKKCFTPYELATCNVRGIKKKPLDPVRVNAIRKEVMTVCAVPLIEQNSVWRQVVKAMDTANRNARRYMSCAL